jgi:glutamate dehydrogenase
MVSNVNDIPRIEGDFTTIKIANDDMPFLVDSVITTIKSHGLTICYYSNSTINVQRKDSLIDDIYPLEESNGIKESVIYVIIKSLSDSFVDALKESIQKTLKAVNCVVKNWQFMLKKLDEAKNLLSVTQQGAEPGKDFLDWLKNNNFVFLGYQEFTAEKDGRFIFNDKESLGLMRANEEYQNSSISSAGLDSLYILRSDLVSKVHRRTYMNCIGIKEFNDQGNVVKERRFFGIFTSVAEVQDVRTIPIIKVKLRL